MAEPGAEPGAGPGAEREAGSEPAGRQPTTGRESAERESGGPQTTSPQSGGRRGTGAPDADIAGVAATARAATRRGPAPVHLWNPPYCGEIDIEIRADGRWFHDGGLIGRPEMVRLFASILKREEGRYFLVTPVEKLGIRVEDAPFVAVDADIGEDRITFTTNLGDQVTASADDPLRVETAADGTPRPYVHVRAGLEALIDRKTFYRLVDAARPGPDGQFCLRSRGACFALGP